MEGRWRVSKRIVGLDRLVVEENKDAPVDHHFKAYLHGRQGGGYYIGFGASEVLAAQDLKAIFDTASESVDAALGRLSLWEARQPVPGKVEGATTSKPA